MPDVQTRGGDDLNHPAWVQLSLGLDPSQDIFKNAIRNNYEEKY